MDSCDYVNFPSGEARLKIDNLIVIGSYGQNSGKTTLATTILNMFSDRIWQGLKVTTVVKGKPCPRKSGHCGVCGSLDTPYAFVRELSRSSNKDTSLMLKHGCEHVYWIRGEAHAVNEPVANFCSVFSATGNNWILCESNSIVNHVQPALFVVMKTDQVPKDSAKAVLQYADYIIDSGNAADLRCVLDHIGRITRAVD